MRTSQANMHDFTLSFAKPYSMQALSLKMYGMESDQFSVAETKSAELWKSLRALQG